MRWTQARPLRILRRGPARVALVMLVLVGLLVLAWQQHRLEETVRREIWLARPSAPAAYDDGWVRDCLKALEARVAALSDQLEAELDDLSEDLAEVEYQAATAAHEARRAEAAASGEVYIGAGPFKPDAYLPKELAREPASSVSWGTSNLSADCR